MERHKKTEKTPSVMQCVICLFEMPFLAYWPISYSEHGGEGVEKKNLYFPAVHPKSLQEPGQYYFQFCLNLKVFPMV